MDLGRVKARGISTTHKAWITNPLRSVLWRLTVPYFEGAGAEVDQRFEILTSEVTKWIQEVNEWVQGLSTEVQQRRPTDLPTGISDPSAQVASYLAGARKDVTALAYRLAGLEEEAARNASTHDVLRGQLDAANERIASLTQQVQDTMHGIDTLAKTLNQRQDAAISGVQTLSERIDLLVRGRSLHVGNGVNIGHGNLVLVPYGLGTHLLVRQHDHIGSRIILGEEWEPHVRIAIEQAARPDGVAIDAGAYIGIHTITMSRCFRSVYAFEPQRGVYQVLCGNMALNGCDNVIARNLALYDRARSMRLAPAEWQEVAVPLVDGHPDYDRISNAAALTFEPVQNGLEEVGAVGIDDLGLSGVAVIKVDTQGADLRVLEGAQQTISRCRPVVLFEWERDLASHHGTTLDGFRQFFSALDYELTVLQQTTPDRQADYLALPR